MKNIKHRSINVLGVAFLLLFLGYYGGITLFPHAHTVGGNVIYHSHPYSTNAQHTHTGFEYQLIKALSSFLFTIFVVAAIYRAICVGYVQQIYNSFPSFTHRCFKIYSLRAPPIYC